MKFKKKRTGGQPPLRREIMRAQKALGRALVHADWFLIGDLSDGPEVGALLDEAATAIYLAREELIKRLGYTPQQGEQTELDLTAPLARSAVCARCGHRTVDHTEGLPCIQCGCATFTEADDESGLCGYGHEGPCPTSDEEEGR